MSNGVQSALTARHATERGSRRGRRALVRASAGALALAGAGGMLVVRSWVNLPGNEPDALLAAYDPVALLATLGPALAALAVGVTAERLWVQVGLVAASVFGAFAAVADAAYLPAIGALLAASAFVAVAARPGALDWSTVRRWLPVAGVATGAWLSLSASLGADPSLVRPLGSNVALLAVALSPVAVRAPRRAWLVGAVAGGAVFGAGLAAPFVMGAAVLVAGGVVGASLPVIAAAAAGGVATAATGAFRGQFDVVAGGLLLVTAGVPATTPRALAVVVGLALLATAEGGR